jgi:endonuclease YncB( thermonuclease family)|tara:strand:- start:192 stop:662 length:471 start_codon:yes stop_codon:yes gene_type:complete
VIRLIIIVVILLNLNTKITAREILGLAYITDGDTVRIANKRIRLHGIDAPEANQKCNKNLEKYNCGSVSTKALIKKINKEAVKCKVQKKKDRYNRFIGVCFVGEVNLNKWMVRNGYAIAYRKYSKDYILDENYAKIKKIGLWSGTFLKPEKWRKLN